MILDTTIARYHASKYKKQAPFTMRSPSNVPQLDKKEDTLKVIYPKYSKHWPYTVAHTIDCVCSKMLHHGLNHGLFLILFSSLYTATYIELYMC